MAFSADNGPYPAAGRGEYVQAKPANLTLSLIGNLYQNSNFTVQLPNNANINSASVDIEGQPVKSATQSLNADFASDPGNMYTAYAGSYSKNTPGTAKPSSFQGGQLSGTELNRIAYSDNNYAYYYVYSTEYGYHRFSFKIPFDEVTKVSVLYEGYAGYTYYGVGTVAAYIWNNQSGGSWENFGVGQESPKSSFSRDYTGNQYMWAQGNYRYIDVLAMCQVGSYPSYPYNFINSDYVKIYVEGKVLTYPKNPKLFVGNAYTPAWSLQEEKFNYLVSVGEAALMNQIQDQTRKATAQFADVRFTFKSETVGTFQVSNLRISFTAPPWCKGIPDDKYLEEDTPNANFLNLNDYFTDDVDGGRLKFEIIYEENPKLLDADISADGMWMGFKMPTKNWHGALKFQVRATDGDSLQRDSNKFTVTVLAVNDPPVVGTIGRQIAFEDTPFTMTVRVRDFDTDLDPEETVVFSDNTTLFEIDQTTGKVAFTPTQDQVGTYLIGITATDLEGATDQENFTLEIQDTEDPPVLDYIPDQSAMQDQLFEHMVSALDPDVPYGDTLTFKDDSPLFVIEPSTGLMSFTPTVDDIGSYKITITVTDAREGTDSKQFTLNVVNPMGTMNRPPSIEPIKNQTAQEGTVFELSVKGNDPDLELGDGLSFQDNCPVFDINSGNGRISFKPTAKDAGVYKVKITVKDREGQTASTEFTLTVIKLNHAPDITEMLPRDGTKVVAGRQFKLSATASDVDGDKLNFTWLDGDKVLGYGQNITMSYEFEGTYIITLIVSDGKLEKANETAIEVVEKISGGGGSSTPGFEAIFAVAAVAVAAALGLARRRKR